MTPDAATGAAESRIQRADLRRARSIARIQIGAEQKDADVVRIWMADNGIGIEPEHQERVFRVFERLRGNDVYAGTGIGLAMVRKTVERMGGRAGVTFRARQGKLFLAGIAGRIKI